MHKAKPELNFFLAQSAIEDVYSRKSKNKLQDLRDSCQNYQYSSHDSGLTFKKFWAQVMQQQVILLLTEATLNALPADMKKFTELRYGRGVQLIGIHVQISVSIAQLSNWNRRVLEMVSRYAIQYQLDRSDLFSRSKVLNLVEVLTIILDFFSRIDPEHKVAAKSWLNTINHRRNQYRKILSAIDDCLRTQNTGMHPYLVAQKILNPNETDAALALTCHVDKGAISRHLREYVDSVEKYLY